jgi:hypothetical protein
MAATSSDPLFRDKRIESKLGDKRRTLQGASEIKGEAKMSSVKASSE